MKGGLPSFCATKSFAGAPGQVMTRESTNKRELMLISFMRIYRKKNLCRRMTADRRDACWTLPVVVQ